MTDHVALDIMFHVMWNKAYSATGLVKKATQDVQDRLPPGWLLISNGSEQRWTPSTRRPDAILEIRDPEGRSAIVVVEVKRKPLEAREVAPLADARRRALAKQGGSAAEDGSVNLMLVTPFLGASARDRLSEQGISFADATGNLRFVLARPAIFIEAQGAARNPWREKLPLRSLKGRATGRAVRAFLDYQPPFGIRQLADATRTSAASVSRVAGLLEREAILTRQGARGPVLAVDWERLLRRWAQDYAFIAANDMRTYLAPRGTEWLLGKLRRASFKYALTGSFAAVRYSPIAEPRLAALYVDDLEAAESLLEVRPAETGGNVLLGMPFDPVVFDRATVFDDLVYSSVSQVAADLLTGPGRGPAEAGSLIQWMRANDSRWQTSLKPAI